MEKFLFILIPIVISIAIYSSGYDNGVASKEYSIESYQYEISDMEDKISLMESCIGSLKQNNADLDDILNSVDSALSIATEPGFGYWPPYEDLIEAHSEAKNAIPFYLSSAPGDCDY